MQTISISAEQLISILIGQHTTIQFPATGLLLLATEKHQTNHLPSEMAGCIVYVDEKNNLTLVSLVHPFKIPEQKGLFTTDDAKIHREPYNWFGPQALIIEKKLADFSKLYDGPLSKNGGIPQALIPDKILKPGLLSDLYWQEYVQYVIDPDGTFKQQIKPLFN